MRTLHTSTQQEDYGGKINHLIELIGLGFQVPKGLIIPSNQVMDWLALEWPVLAEGATGWVALQSIDRAWARQRLAQRPLNPDWIQAVKAFCQEGQPYIVRSSALMEDQVGTSFAGQYDSVADCRQYDTLEEGIRTCIASLFNPEAQAYWQRQALPWEDFGFAILIQEQIEPTVSGVCFTLDIQTNDDQTMLIEYVEGSAEALVSGQVSPHQLRLAWYHPDWPETAPCLAPSVLKQLHLQVLAIAAHFGRPMDIEWCARDQGISLVQVRPITMLPSTVAEGRWTTANFRDGGVAAQPCPGLMWSLYYDAWQGALGSFLRAIDLAPSDTMPALSRIQYARPYWNLGVVKQSMAQIPGYIERDFDDELGVHKDYSGTGQVSTVTPSSLVHFLKVAWRTQRLTRRFLARAPQQLQALKQSFVDTAAAISAVSDETPLATLEGLWRQVVTTLYRDSEGTYFWQAYINTVQLAMKKTALLKWLSLDEFFQLIAHLGEVSHTQPLAALVDIAQLIRQEATFMQDWQRGTPADIARLLAAHPQRRDARELARFLEAYGHHSWRELDLRVASYQESPEHVIATIQRLVTDDAYFQSAHQATTPHNGVPLDLCRFSKWKRRKIQRLRAELRELLWWREAFKDCSTHCYHLIRQVSLALAKAYQARGYLEASDDIWYLTTWELIDFMEDAILAPSLQERARHNRHYCQSYRCLEPMGDLTEKSFVMVRHDDVSRGQLVGMPASSGQVTGRVRVLSDVAELGDLEPGEILVTRYTDTGWSYVFGILGGLVTEYGGVLCHASIVARECGIPALVCVEQAMQRLKTGMLVTLDAEKGVIHIHD